MGDATNRGVRAMLAPLQRKLAMMAARAVVRLVNDTEGRQRLQAEVLKGEIRDGIERAQNYGFTSHPHPGADAVVISVGGTREQAIAIVVDDRRYRLKLQPGEVALHDDLGNAVKLLRDKVHVVGIDEVHVEAPIVRVGATDVIIDATTTTVNSDLNVNGNTTFTGEVSANGKRIDDTHTHSGVEPGGGSTGTPN